MRKTLPAVLAALAVSFTPIIIPEPVNAQDQRIWSIDGYSVACQGNPIHLSPNLPDVGMARPGLILLNPYALQGMSTSHKLFVVAHECAHAIGISNEGAADCFAIRLGRDQGWFPSYVFGELIEALRYNPGDYTHAPGTVRLNAIIQCFQT
ncbi:MAG: hypothetical protein PSV23_05545 [Brevundimonas sp.]|uniref:hypothetical protein n=1 Tax=Brevundimonas sp. TaxID=1871086 RepID=UPI002489CE7C|nr:hypothetical protein [Brevundimonas sp.]MDI1326247.1 hypothetical protein [Brevundimonas sp.]